MARLHHVGMVMRNERAARAFMDLLGLTERHRGYVPEWQALCIFATGPEGGTPLELVVADGGPLKEFNKGAGGVHHVALEVKDLAAATEKLAAKGVAMLADKPVKGAGPFLCNFIQPVFTQGSLVELVQVIEP